MTVAKGRPEGYVLSAEDRSSLLRAPALDPAAQSSIQPNTCTPLHSLASSLTSPSWLGRHGRGSVPSLTGNLPNSLLHPTAGIHTRRSLPRAEPALALPCGLATGAQLTQAAPLLREPRRTKESNHAAKSTTARELCQPLRAPRILF